MSTVIVVIICTSLVLMVAIYCIKEYLVSREIWYKKFELTIEELRNDFQWLELESKNMFNEINKLMSRFEKDKGGEL